MAEMYLRFECPELEIGREIVLVHDQQGAFASTVS
ncbi:hypothetical protein GGE43_003519 [Agrobacterium tumefaciens]|jgi:hypothetical protein|uniref:Uncharacterized protein n=1 Tax=Agrobacterium radiobacter TaxID=362 RepID=A0ABR6JAS5_AGRRD|nr:hypothetical protein At1D1460_39830 [Agrobacterium tumefaciens]MBB4283397.1 hypothetical protein [Agrobacterium radiobacter]MCP2136499.1 hypothetical protein [Rhizobium sp. SLBN-94]AYM84144.1 hypothetical protein At12D1_42620 [Agrobacterium tumefaciens]MBB4320092.1 hypothetical protein [Agrobacterium radiobacter]